MTRKIFKALVTTVSLAVLVLATDPSMARGHGGGGGGRGGGHFGGHGAHFSGAHFSGAHFSGARMGRSRFSAAHISGRNFSRMSRSRGNIAHVNAAHVHGLGAAALGTRAAWNHGNWNHGWNHWGNNWRGGWNGGCCGGWWFGGPVFWPFFTGDLLAFTFWPWGFYDPFWAYGNMFVWDAMFWPGPQYAYGPYDDVYGGYAYGGPPRTRVARRATPETTGSVNDSADLAQSCGGLAPGVTDLPIDKIQQSLQLNDDQLKSLNALKAASSQASDALKASCSSELSMTPLGRLDSVQRRLDGMVQAWGTLRTPLDGFYNSLNDEQRQRFAALGPASGARSNRRAPASGDNLAALCNSRTESFTQLPVQRIEQAVKPAQQQQDALEKLKAASTDAANELQASCPAQLPQTAIDRFDAVGKRLNAMAGAIKRVRPALADFYSSLTDEQKARFNNLKSPEATPSHPG
jgi:LTXXQ motif family protein/pentapeptide repeat protein